MDTVNQQEPAAAGMARAWAASDLVTEAFRALPIEDKLSVLAGLVSFQGQSLAAANKKLRDARCDLNTLRTHLETHTHNATGEAVIPLQSRIPHFVYQVE